MDFVIASAANATDFGNLTTAVSQAAGFASTTRGITSGGYETSSSSNVMQFVTIASAGNASDFGDLTVARFGLGGCASATRGLSAGEPEEQIQLTL